MQSFSETVKEEICKTEDKDICQFIFYSLLKISSEYNLQGFFDVKTRYPFVVKFIKKNCDINNIKNEIFYSDKKTLKDNKTKYLIRIEINDFSNVINIIEYNKIIKSKNKKQIATIISAMFLTFGSVNSLNKYPHLEFRCNTEQEKIFLINAFSLFGLKPKFIQRKNKYLLYFKKQQEISDVLKIINAQQAMFILEEKRIENDFVNNYQRLINLEVSNMKRISKASIEQSNICSVVKSSIYYETLNEREKLYCDIRSKDKISSMQQICDHMNKYLPTNKKISKGSLSHIVNKVKELYTLL